MAVMEVHAGSEARATACSILAAGRISRNSGSQRWRRQSVEKETRELLQSSLQLTLPPSILLSLSHSHTHTHTFHHHINEYLQLSPPSG